MSEHNERNWTINRIHELEALLRAEKAACRHYIAENERLRGALQKIADTSPNWMAPNAVADSERRMRAIAQDALTQEQDDEAE